MASYGGRDIDNFADKIRNDKKKNKIACLKNTQHKHVYVSFSECESYVSSPVHLHLSLSLWLLNA